MRANPGVAVPSGVQVFGPGPDAETWDALVASGKRLAEGQALRNPDGYDLGQMMQAMAVTLVRIDQYHQAQGGNLRPA